MHMHALVGCNGSQRRMRVLPWTLRSAPQAPDSANVNVLLKILSRYTGNPLVLVNWGAMTRCNAVLSFGNLDLEISLVGLGVRV